MKIVYLHQYFVTPAMPGATRSYEMGRRLVEFGHEVHVITTDQSGTGTSLWRESQECGIHVHWAGLPYNNSMGFLKRIGAFAAFAFLATVKAITLGGDVIYATSTPLTIAIPALIASFVRRVPFVFEVRDMWPDVPIAMGVIKNPLLVWAVRTLELTTYRRAKHIVALAPGMKDDIVAKGIPEDKITVITQGCDLSLLATPAVRSPRAEHAWLGNRKFVLYAGAIGKANGVGYLVRLARRVKTIDPEVRFVIIGSGKEKEAVRQLAQSDGVWEETLFMLDAMPKVDLVPWLQAADMHIALFTGPRVLWKDAVQNKFFDALATGKPIANNFDGWQSRFAVDKQVGIILDPSDDARAAAELVAKLGDKEWLEGVPARARVCAETHFDRQKQAKQLESLFITAAGGTHEKGV